MQAVLLGLHDRRIKHHVRTATPPALFLKAGVMMPAARINDGPWMLDSASILKELGFDSVSADDAKAIGRAWTGVTHRTDNALRFFNRFSMAGDPGPSFLGRTWHNFWRSFSTCYFFTLISGLNLFFKRPDPDNFGDQYLYWEKRLDNQDFMNGQEPDIVDFQLFGIVQCHASIPVPPMDPLIHDERLGKLRDWVLRMQARFVDYPYLYSRYYFESDARMPYQADLFQRGVFWLGAGAMIVSFPITVPLIAFAVFRGRRV